MNTGLGRGLLILTHPFMSQQEPFSGPKAHRDCWKEKSGLQHSSCPLAMFPDCLKLSQTFLQVCTQCLLNKSSWPGQSPPPPSPRPYILHHRTPSPPTSGPNPKCPFHIRPPLSPSMSSIGMGLPQPSHPLLPTPHPQPYRVS